MIILTNFYGMNKRHKNCGFRFKLCIQWIFLVVQKDYWMFLFHTISFLAFPGDNQYHILANFILTNTS